RIFSLIRRTLSCRCLTAAWKTSGRGDRATSGLDLLLRGLGERVNGEFELHPADVSVAKHLHKFTLVDDATGDELVLADLATLREHAGQIAHVHSLVLGTEAVVETTQLRKPHVDGHLPTLKADRYVLPSLSALRTAVRRLTALGSLTATNADLLPFGTRRRLQVVDLDGHYLTSSTVTRCRTA